MSSLLSNLASSKLVTGITIDSITLTLTGGTGTAFPTLTGADTFNVVLEDIAKNIEVCLVTARVGDILTVVRGQENTVKRAYSVGDRVALRMTAGAFNSKEDKENKNKSGGFVGLTLLKINFLNALNTFTSFFTNSNTGVRTYTFQDRDGIILDNTDFTILNTAVLGSDRIANNAVIESKIAAGAVTETKILNGGVTNIKIATGAVTPAKLSTGGPSWAANGVLQANAFTATGEVTRLTRSNPPLVAGSYETGNLEVKGVNSSPVIGLHYAGVAARTIHLDADGVTRTIDNNGVVQRFFHGVADGAAPVFACRAWAAYNGVSGALISGGNIAFVTKNSVGNYTFAFAVPMPDANYSVVISGNGAVNVQHTNGYVSSKTAAAVNIVFHSSASSANLADQLLASIAVFR